jgi:hypothetical protein
VSEIVREGRAKCASGCPQAAICIDYKRFVGFRCEDTPLCTFWRMKSNLLEPLRPVRYFGKRFEFCRVSIVSSKTTASPNARSELRPRYRYGCAVCGGHLNRGAVGARIEDRVIGISRTHRVAVDSQTRVIGVEHGWRESCSPQGAAF